LPPGGRDVYTDFFVWRFMMAKDEFDPLAPQREAAFFYGLFLRGHSADALRQDIDVPPTLLEKWMRANDFEASFRANLQRVYTYRKQVLAIFNGLVLNEQNQLRLQ
jgi:hypothetical protein